MERIRIRKLTPCECLRLMGFSREDFDNLKDAGQSDSAIYHEAGDSIVVNCLIGLIGSLTELDHGKISREWARHCSEGIE